MPFFLNKKIILILGCLTIFFVSCLACFIGIAFGGLFTVSALLILKVKKYL